MKHELNDLMASVPPGLEAADRLCQACVDLLGVDGAAISMVQDGFSFGTYGASSEVSRRLDEYQFTFGEGPCLDAAATGGAVLVPDLDSVDERRWPAFAAAVVDEGVRAVFALPIMLTTACVGALDLFREGPGPLGEQRLAAGWLAAELAAMPLLDLVAGATVDQAPEDDGVEQLADLDRVEVYQATGMLVSQLDVDPDEALVRLRAHAIATGQTAKEVAWAILERRLVLERDPDDRRRKGG
ncbi:GAF and ANTAR domain-containing protein [Oryzobacter telluris]|uniref:GAF and ANTAR domain-containing protein n=1 Tax=Oryzobacter telluris TaxID=3149179 RepID=UPI00370D5239